MRIFNIIASVAGVVFVYLTNFAPEKLENWAWGLDTPDWMVFIRSTPREYYGIHAVFYLAAMIAIVLALSISTLKNRGI